MSRRALNRLERKREVQTAFVECLGATTATVARELLVQFPGPTPAQNTPQEDLCLQLYERVNEPAVVVLDEAAHIHQTDALDRLADLPELHMLAICHDPDEWLAGASDGVRRRFHGQEFQLERYQVGELADILDAQAIAGLRPESVEREALEQIADQTAGVPRPEIQTLREAALESERRGYDRIPVSVLDEAKELAQRQIREWNLRSLPFHH